VWPAPVVVATLILLVTLLVCLRYYSVFGSALSVITRASLNKEFDSIVCCSFINVFFFIMLYK
jgi:hypothetical protein